ncbi:MAG: hypothetical protein OXK77_05745 [Gemmatimonadota bacterium]|nr:hypothetical protein [Gemmatimonadota bacterium]MDE2866041.1 hypothetical protein [Gemmatimonadota bacterium]
MSETTDQDEIVTVIPTRITALSRGRSHLLDRLMLSRRRRRALIRDIETQSQRVVLCYVSEGGSIMREDALYLETLLQGVEPGANITLLLNSPGGDPDAAEKLLHMLREMVSPPAPQPSGSLEIVVPNEAKSAATLIALGADRLTMSDTSELGPIDPQVEIRQGDTVLLYPVAACLAAYEAAERRCQEHPNNSTFRAAFEAFDHATIEDLRMANQRTRQLAERIAKRHGWNYTAVADALMDTNRFPSHGQMIDWQAARQIGLDHVEYRTRTDPLWNRFWELYLALRSVAGEQTKIFESRTVTRLG